MYKLKLLESLKIIHLIVHVSHLIAFHIDADNTNRDGPSTTPVLVMDRFKQEVKELLAHYFIIDGWM